MSTLDDEMSLELYLKNAKRIVENVNVYVQYPHAVFGMIDA